MLIPVLKGLKPTKEEALLLVFYIRQLKQTAKESLRHEAEPHKKDSNIAPT